MNVCTYIEPCIDHAGIIFSIIEVEKHKAQYQHNRGILQHNREKFQHSLATTNTKLRKLICLEFQVMGSCYTSMHKDLRMNDTVNDMNILIVGLNFKALHMWIHVK